LSSAGSFLTTLRDGLVMLLACPLFKVLSILSVSAGSAFC